MGTPSCLCDINSSRFISLYSNLLLNIGPMADGTLDPVFEERLLEMGAWLNVSIVVLFVVVLMTCIG